MQVRSLGQEEPLEKGMATPSSILAWRIPWTEEPGGLYSPWGRKESDTTEQLSLHAMELTGLGRGNSGEREALKCGVFWLLFCFVCFFKPALGDFWDISSWTSDRTWAPWWWKLGLLTTGPPGNSQRVIFKVKLQSLCKNSNGITWDLVHDLHTVIIW